MPGRAARATPIVLTSHMTTPTDPHSASLLPESHAAGAIPGDTREFPFPSRRPLLDRRKRAAILVGALGIGVTIAVAPFLLGLIGAPVLYVVFQPLHRRLSRSLAPSRAAVLVLLVALLLVILPALVVGGVILAEVPAALAEFARSDVMARLGTLRIGPMAVGTEIAKAGGAIFGWISGQAVVILGSVTGAAINLLIAFFGLYYLLRSGPAVWHEFARYLPFSRATRDRLKDTFFRTTVATLLGVGLTALLQGLVVGTGFWLVGLDRPLLWGSLTAVVSVLPVLGSALIWFPAVVLLILQDRAGAALALGLIGGGIAANIDNVIRPIVYKRVSNIHPLITLVGAFAGLRFFGLLGVLLGPMALAYFFELLRAFEEEYGGNPLG
jgi:predicted PurR-regulated permease PerM